MLVELPPNQDIHNRKHHAICKLNLTIIQTSNVKEFISTIKYCVYIKQLCILCDVLKMCVCKILCTLRTQLINKKLLSETNLSVVKNSVRLLSSSRISFEKKANDNSPIESPLKKLLDDAASFDDINPQRIEQQWATLPYIEGTSIRKQGEFLKKPKPKHDPRDTSIILFPGQGSQYVGMGRELLKFPMAKDLYDLASYILGYNLLELCLNGPKEKLDQTRYSQPAILVTSLAAVERLKEERPGAIDNCMATAGFSLGELTALIFAGAIDFEKGNTDDLNKSQKSQDFIYKT